MVYRRTAVLSLIGIGSSVLVLLTTTVAVGGYRWLSDLVGNSWRYVVEPVEPSLTERHLREYDFTHLVPAAPSLSSLQPGDVVSMDVESRGCFHHDRYSLEFRGDEPDLVVVTAFGESGEPELAVRHILTPGQRRRLDGALAFYRDVSGDPRFLCTTRQRIAVNWRNRGSAEVLEDATCLLDSGNPYALAPVDLAWMATTSREP